MALPPDETSNGAAAIWGLLGNRRGDNALIEAVMHASELPGQAQQLGFNPLGALQNLLPRGSLFSVTEEARARLSLPWPSVVLTSGKRAVPVALWIKRASGGRTRLVHLGRPQAPLAWFDLVITTPQYQLPARSNVVVYRLPATASVERDEAGPLDLADLPRPRLVAIVGGSVAPQTLDAATAEDLVETALAKARALGGSLLIVTSPRTSRSATAAVKGALEGVGAPVRLSLYGDGPNLYRAFLSAADRFLVTDDSVSMVVEAAATGRPVELFRLPERPGSLLRLLRAVEAFAGRWPSTAALFVTLAAQGLIRSNRDISGYMRSLESDGLLAGGDSLPRLAAEELADAGRRVRALAGSHVLPEK